LFSKLDDDGPSLPLDSEFELTLDNVVVTGSGAIDVRTQAVSSADLLSGALEQIGADEQFIADSGLGLSQADIAHQIADPVRRLAAFKKLRRPALLSFLEKRQAIPSDVLTEDLRRLCAELPPDLREHHVGHLPRRSTTSSKRGNRRIH
jgi:hypothetical protein